MVRSASPNGLQESRSYPERMTSLPPASPGIGILRVLVGGVVVEILVFTYVIGIPRQGASLVDYFGYFTNLTLSLIHI